MLLFLFLNYHCKPQKRILSFVIYLISVDFNVYTTDILLYWSSFSSTQTQEEPVDSEEVTGSFGRSFLDDLWPSHSWVSVGHSDRMEWKVEEIFHFALAVIARELNIRIQNLTVILVMVMTDTQSSLISMCTILPELGSFNDIITLT